MKCLFLQKLIKLTLVISKNWIYYAAYNNAKYYIIASYLHGKSKK